MIKQKHMELNYKIIFLIFSIVIVINIIACDKVVTKEIKIDSTKEIEQNYDLINCDFHIIQWQWFNNQEFNIFHNDYSAWLDDEKIYNEININIPNDISNERQKTVVAVIDCGVNINLLDSKKVWTNENEIPDNNIDDDKNGYIDDYYGYNFVDDTDSTYYELDGPHGTYISSILIGNNDTYEYSGLLCNSNVEVMCLKALSGIEQTGKIEDVVKAIKYAENMGVNICCMSLNTYYDSEELRNVMDSSDMLFIIPAGNDGEEIAEDFKVYPTLYKCDNILSVADIRLDGNISYTSNYSRMYVDVLAPGTDIVGIYSDEYLISLSGTSSAAAITTACAVYVRNAGYKELAAEQIKKYICDNVTTLPHMKDKCRTSGYLNLQKAIEGVHNEK